MKGVCVCHVYVLCMEEVCVCSMSCARAWIPSHLSGGFAIENPVPPERWFRNREARRPGRANTLHGGERSNATNLTGASVGVRPAHAL